MEKEINKVIYESHDTPFGSYTLRFPVNTYNTFNRRVLENLAEFQKTGDLDTYDLVTGVQDGTKDLRYFKTIPKFESSNPTEDIVEIWEAEVSDVKRISLPAEAFLGILDKMTRGLFWGGYCYDKARKCGVTCFNGTAIRFEFCEKWWRLYWDDENLYSLGILKEEMQEVIDKQELDLHIEWYFSQSQDGVKDCYVYFRE